MKKTILFIALTFGMIQFNNAQIKIKVPTIKKDKDKEKDKKEEVKSDPKKDTKTNTPTNTNTATTPNYKLGDIVEFLYGETWTEGEVVQIGGSGRYQILHETLYTWAYPKDMRATNKPSANIERERLAEQKKKDDAAAAQKEKEDQVGVVEGEQYKQFMADADFAVGAVGQLCYYLEKAPSQAPGFEPEKLSETMKTLEKLDNLIKQKYPNAKSANYVSRFSTAYSQQPGLFREVAEQRKELAQKALAYSIKRRVENIVIWSFEKEMTELKKPASESTYPLMMCRSFLEYAYFPKSLAKIKDIIKSEYGNAYTAAGLTYKDEEVFANLNDQLNQVKKIVEGNINTFTLEKAKGYGHIHLADAEAEAASSFKLDHPEAKQVYIGCSTDYIVSYDTDWDPPKNLGCGTRVLILAKVEGISHLVAYECAIDKKYVGGGKYGPAYLNANGFYFSGLVNAF